MYSSLDFFFENADQVVEGLGAFESGQVFGEGWCAKYAKSTDFWMLEIFLFYYCAVLDW